jgi:hypothetical protein
VRSRMHAVARRVARRPGERSLLRPCVQRTAYAGTAEAPRTLVGAAGLRPTGCHARARQAAAKELRCAQKRVTENRTRVRGEPPVNSAAAAAAAQRLRADDGAGRPGAAPAVRASAAWLAMAGCMATFVRSVGRVSRAPRAARSGAPRRTHEQACLGTFGRAEPPCQPGWAHAPHAAPSLPSLLTSGCALLQWTAMDILFAYAFFRLKK